MLVIRSEQIEVFENSARYSFENEMVLHLAEFSPPLFNAIKENSIRKAIRIGIDKAESYGLTFRGPVRLYLELMLLFGTAFDTDPQYPWAADILTNKNSGTQMERAQRLYEHTMDYREQVAGPDDNYTFSALRNIRALARQPLALSSENIINSILSEITRIYPQKATYIGINGLEALIRSGIDGARKQHFSTARGTALVVVLMLAFGHGCGSDPLYPWIARTLKDETIVSPQARAERLEKKALIWLEHVLAYFNKGAP